MYDSKNVCNYLLKVKRKVCFLVIDFTWKVFSQTGNIETYLLMKELEKESDIMENNQNGSTNDHPIETNM
ncbi:YqzL-like protein [Ornithinibacillus halophilus]|uniref:YqzL-like protein n=1 Tax=Ornithinibacillus halophilus TaxID=930117 RepID=A0A1M5DNI5_9BACI|nr:YqzL-like protein [Ornithinibacillus halophilus]